MHEFVRLLYLLLPAGVANTIPPVLTRILGPGRPIDGGRTWRGRAIFGAHKTWQGLIGGTIAGTLAFLTQRAFDHVPIPWIAGVAMSFGALAGDLVKSFAKRRLNVAPGKSWIPFDQIDYIAGALLLASPFIAITWRAAAVAIVIYCAAHVVVSLIGYALRIKTDPL